MRTGSPGAGGKEDWKVTAELRRENVVMFRCSWAFLEPVFEGVRCQATFPTERV